jgi:polar amino acid transport system substrate-binding protein
MRRHLKLLLPLVALALVAAACSSSDDTTTTAAAAATTTTAAGSAAGDLGGRTVTVAVENAYPPYNYIPAGSSDGAGWDYDVWREICNRLNCTAEFVEAVWPDLIIETGQGQYDTAGDGISITEERKDTVAFSDPYMTVDQKLMLRLDEDRYPTVQSFIDDADARLGTQVGTTNYNLGAEILGGEDRIDAYDVFGVAVQALISGDVDAVIIDDTAGQGFKGVNADELKLIDEALQSDPLGFIYAHDSDLIEIVNTVLKEMADDGFLDQMAIKWFVEFESP